jgi:hypothetical protein
VLSERFPAKAASLHSGPGHAPADASGLRLEWTWSFRDKLSRVLILQLLNVPGHGPWALGQATLTGPNGEPVSLLRVWMEPAELAPGQRGRVRLETKALWETYRVELMDPSGQRSLSFTVPSK